MQPLNDLDETILLRAIIWDLACEIVHKIPKPPDKPAHGGFISFIPVFPRAERIQSPSCLCGSLRAIRWEGSVEKSDNVRCEGWCPGIFEMEAY